MARPFSPEKLKETFSVRTLSSILFDSFSQKELSHLMASMGLVIPGVRLETLGAGELAETFAEDAWNDPYLMNRLVQALDKAHGAEIEEMARISPQEIRDLLKPIAMIWKERQTGKLVWALLRDERQEVNDLIAPFLDALSDFLEKEKKSMEKMDRMVDRIAADRPNKNDVRMMKDYLSRLSRDRKQDEKEAVAKERQMEKMALERDRLRSELAVLRREKDELRSQCGRIQKELHGKEEEIRGLCSDLERIRREQAEADSVRQKLHHLERENRKQAHEMNRLTEQLNLLQSELEAGKVQLLRLAQERENSLQEKCRIEQALALQENRLTALAAGAQESPMASRPLPPKAKGKRLGIFVDMQNILIASRRYLRKIDFQKLLDFLILDRHLVKALAYVVEDPEWRQQDFFDMLRRKGFEVRTRPLIRRADGSAKGNWDTGIVVDAIHLADQKDLDIVLVVSGDGDFIELMKFLKTKGIRVEAAGFPFNTAQNLPGSVDEFFPLDEQILKAGEKMGVNR